VPESCQGAKTMEGKRDPSNAARMQSVKDSEIICQAGIANSIEEPPLGREDCGHKKTQKKNGLKKGKEEIPPNHPELI